MVHTILTHPGGAHKDEVLAACVLLARHAIPIVRREPSPAELEDPSIIVVDVGGEHDPERMNFDHHHFPREHPPTSSLSLVLDHMGLYEDARQLCDWLETTEHFDSRGPKKTAEWLGVPRRAISQLHSPIDMTLLRRFSRAARLEPGEPVYEFMRLVGEDLLEFLGETRAQIDRVTRRVQRWSIERGDRPKIEALFLPRAEPVLDEPSAALAHYARVAGLEGIVAALVYPDRRGEGYGIGRLEDHPGLDFSRVEAEPDVHFAHRSGFMCKTSATRPERLRELIAAAWIDR